MAGAEEFVTRVVLWLKLVVEVTGALMIGAGLIAVALVWFGSLRTPGRNVLDDARLRFARFLALALELQLGADILSTAVAPGWEQIGKLGAIAVIRTALNFFLQREFHAEASKAHPALLRGLKNDSPLP